MHPRRPDAFDLRAAPFVVRALGVSIVGASALMQGCATENVSEVIVTSVSVQPANVAVVEGDTVELDAVVVDEGGTTLTGASVQWSSDAPDVVFVDEWGIARGLTDGVATVEASFRGVTGAATVMVLPGPSIELNPASVSILGGAGGPRPPSERVLIENGGMGTVSDLAAEVRYEPGEAVGWLAVELDSGDLPAALTLVSDIGELQAGSYDATVVVTSDDESIESAELPVRLVLAGFTLVESEAGTIVHESGTTEVFTVALDLEPTTNVVLSVSSTDTEEVIVSPGKLTFSPSDWTTPRTVTVTGVDDDIVDGDRTTSVNVSVDPGSGTAYTAVEPQVVEVTVLDDDVADFVIAHTGTGTFAREGGAPDTLTVVLGARPLSDVVFTVSSDYEADGTVSPDTLRFTAADWNVLQPVTFTAVDDGVFDGARRRTVTVAVDAALSDAAFHALSKAVDAITLDRWVW